MLRKIFTILVLFNFTAFALDVAFGKEEVANQEAEQKMMDFSLCGFNQKGAKSWEVKGNSADIFSDIVKLTTVNANVYGEEEKINLVADNGEYRKTDGKMHLENNVVITTQSGGKLTTNSLDWDRAVQKVTTDDLVNIEKENIKAVGKGLEGEPNLKKVFLKDNVTVQVEGQGLNMKGQDKDNVKEAVLDSAGKTDTKEVNKEPTVITCSGPLEIDYGNELAIFNNNVKVDQKEQGEMYSDKMEVYFDFTNKKILRIKSTGNVKIVKGENTSYSDEATYSAADKKMILTGRPRLVIYSEENLTNNAPTGN